MTNTKQWAASHGLCVDDIVPPIEDYNEPRTRTAEDVRSARSSFTASLPSDTESIRNRRRLAQRSIDMGSVSPNEQAYLCAENASAKEGSDARWRQEAQWALLWAIAKVEALGLPTRTCDTTRLVDEIMPALGDAIDQFVSSAVLRPPAVVLGEDDRTYNLHCYARKAYRDGSMPKIWFTMSFFNATTPSHGSPVMKTGTM